MKNETMPFGLDDLPDCLRTRPETYKTLVKRAFGVECGYNSASKITRKRVHRLFMACEVFEMTLSGSRWGEKLLYVPDKKYLVFVLRNEQGWRYAWCNKATDASNKCVLMEDAFVLEGSMWKSMGNWTIPSRDVFKWF